MNVILCAYSWLLCVYVIISTRSNEFVRSWALAILYEKHEIDHKIYSRISEAVFIPQNILAYVLNIHKIEIFRRNIN